MRGVVFAAMLSTLAACDSPEASRVRGGGPGADTGNRTGELLMHEGSKPYHQTPQLTPAKSGPIDAASQAHELSLR